MADGKGRVEFNPRAGCSPWYPEDHAPKLTGLEPASEMPVRLRIAADILVRAATVGDSPAFSDFDFEYALKYADALIAAHNATAGGE